MKAMKLMLILALVVVGLVSRRHTQPQPDAPVVRASATTTAVDHEIVQNAERLAETLRRCQQTAQNNRQTK